MISFRPSEEESSFIDVTRSIAKDKIRPMARTAEEKREVDPNLVNELANLGLLSLELTEYWKGLELSLVSQVQIMSALSYGDLGIIQGLPGAGDATSIFRLVPNHEVLQPYMSDIENHSTVGLLDVRDDEWGNGVTLTRQNAGYCLNGTSHPIRMGQFAKYIVLFAEDSNGETVVLWLDKQMDKWVIPVSDYRLGLLAAGISKITFTNQIIDQERIIATGKAAEDLINKMKTRMMILQAAKEVGLMEAALDYATEYTAVRKAFGQEIARFQGVSFKVADMAIETRAANHLVLAAAEMADENNPLALGLATRALYRSHRSLRFVTDAAVQLLGGHGFIQEFPVEKWMRDARTQVALYGSEQSLLRERGEQILREDKVGVNT